MGFITGPVLSDAVGPTSNNDNPQDSSSAYDAQLAAIMTESMFTGKKHREDASNYANYYQHLGDQLFQKEQTELEWSRNSPAAQLQQLMALGMTRQQALQAIQGATATAAQSTTGQATTADAGLTATDVISAVGTAASAASGVFGIIQGAKLLGANIMQAQALAQLAKVNAKIADEVYKGINVENSWTDAWRAIQDEGNIEAYKLDAYDVKTHGASKATVTKAILAAAKKGLPEAQAFVSSGYPFMNDHYASRYIDESFTSDKATKAWRATETDNEFYDRQLKAQTLTAELQPRKLVAEIENLVSNTAYQDSMAQLVATQEESIRKYQNPLYAAQRNLTESQKRGQDLANTMLGMDVEFREATFNDVKSAAILRVGAELQEISQLTSPEAMTARLETLLNDVESAKALSATAKLFAEKRWNMFSNDDNIMNMVTYFGDENVQSAFETLSKSATVESSTSERTVGVGPLKMTDVHGTDAAQKAAYLRYMFFHHMND